MTSPGGPQRGDTRNLILAIGLSMLVLFGFEYFFARPQRLEQQAIERAQAERQAEAPRAEAALPGETVVARTQTRRVVIDTPEVDGSIALNGARIDDLSLRNYRRTVEEDSPEVRLLSPREGEGGADAFFGWEAREGAANVADSNTQWNAQEGARLTPDTPVTLTHTTADGIEITRTIAVDQHYMFTITDRVRNTGSGARAVRPYGVVRREGTPPDYAPNMNVQQGLAGVFGPEEVLRFDSYRDAQNHARDRDRGRVGESERIRELQGPGGWLGLSDHYWLTALVPDQGERISAWFDSRNEAEATDFRAAYRGAWRELAPGAEATYTQRLYAGAKRYEILREYQRQLNIPDFDKAIDWGNIFWFLTRPLFAVMHFFGGLLGAFGLAILATTIVVKLLLFPLVFQSNVAMTKMRKVAPMIKDLQERFAADKQRLQQETIRLYQTEKINPVAGCLPILLQIPVFFALYKVLSVTIEMRHAPFYGWINDLAARDPTNLFNLFGLLPAIGIPFHPETIPFVGQFLWVGAWACLYGVSMMALQALSPPPTDPTQAAIFRWLPILFTFLFAGFAAGLVIYWTWSNTLSILQQYIIMRRMGVETEFDKWLAKRFGKRETNALVE
ncbi:MAG: membrane protein insertase YidC [Hyphomonadaceae bacterium]